MNSMPGIWLNPFATSLAWYTPFLFTLNTHLHPTNLQSCGQSLLFTCLHTPMSNIFLNSRQIASHHFSLAIRSGSSGSDIVLVGVSLPNTFPMKKYLKSRNPALSIPRKHEAVATDTIFSDTPTVDSGVKQAQVFVGRDTRVADAYPMKRGKQFVNTLQDNIRRRGAIDKLLSDSAKTEISNKVMDILRAYHISNWHSEPSHQNQNSAEWRYRTIKSWTNTVMNRSGAPANCWLLCLIYVGYLLNHIACNALDGKIPLLALTGITPDISIIYFSLSTNLCSMPHMTKNFLLKVKRGLATG